MPDQDHIEVLKQKFSEYSQYIDDIRKRVFALIICFIIFFTVGFFCTNKIIRFIIKVTTVPGATIVTTSPFQLLNIAMSVGIATAFIICSPFAIYLLYDFLKDALDKKEKKYFLFLLPISLLLFLIGFGYGFGILYFCLKIIAEINIGLGIKNIWDIDKFLSQIISTSALLGLTFEYPIVLTFLVRIRIIDVKFLKHYRRHAIAVIFILVSLLPPTDGLSLIIMALPLIAIYEINIIVNYFLNRKKMINLPERS